jgi:hypothetical protein
LKVLKIHNYTGILPIIHILFCSESRNMLRGPICNFSKVWGLNCNFHKLRDQTEILSSSTSNLEFQQKTYCSFHISSSKFTIYTNHNSKSSSLPTIFHNQLNNQLPTTINSITFKLIHQLNPKQNLQKPNIYQNRNLKLKEHIFIHNLTFKLIFSNSFIFPF